MRESPIPSCLSVCPSRDIGDDNGDGGSRIASGESEGKRLSQEERETVSKKRAQSEEAGNEENIVFIAISFLHRSI